MKPNIQDYFRYHYDGSGNLQISISNEFVKELGWGKDLELSFGGIRAMNDWGTDPTLTCLLYTSPSPRDAHESRMPSSA